MNKTKDDMTEQNGELLLTEILRQVDNFCKTTYNKDHLSFCQNGCPIQDESRNRRRLLAKARPIIEKQERERVIKIYTRYREILSPAELRKTMLGRQALKGEE